MNQSGSDDGELGPSPFLQDRQRNRLHITAAASPAGWGQVPPPLGTAFLTDHRDGTGVTFTTNSFVLTALRAGDLHQLWTKRVSSARNSVKASR